MNTITATGAHIMVQALCRSFVDQAPAREEPAAWVTRALALQDSIACTIGFKPTADDIKELVTSYEELESIGCGTHQDLDRNAAGTVDNTLALTEQLIKRINDETWTLLNNSGFNTVRSAA